MNHIKCANPAAEYIRRKTREGLILADVLTLRLWCLIMLVIATFGNYSRADLSLETETARILPPGHFELSGAFEFQTSRDGEEYAVPLALEFGLIDRLELLIEPVPFISIHPNGGSTANGLGDTEVSLSYLVFKEMPNFPAIALAGEVKFPTARDKQIGSREFDYRIYGIASKRFGNVDLHFNVGYNFIGEPSGVSTRNPIDLELAAEWFINEKFDLFAEVTYIGSSLGSSSSNETPAARHRIRASREVSDTGGGTVITPEIAGEEIVGSVGLRYHVNRNVDLFTSFSYDNNDDKLLRTGFSIKF